VKNELLRGERDERVGAGIARRGGAEDNGNQRRKRTSVGGRRPWNEILHILALSRGKNGKE